MAKHKGETNDLIRKMIENETFKFHILSNAPAPFNKREVTAIFEDNAKTLKKLLGDENDES